MLKCKICGTEFPAIKERLTLREIMGKPDCQVLSVQTMKKRFMTLLTARCVAARL